MWVSGFRRFWVEGLGLQGLGGLGFRVSGLRVSGFRRFRASGTQGLKASGVRGFLFEAFRLLLRLLQGPLIPSTRNPTPGSPKPLNP